MRSFDKIYEQYLNSCEKIFAIQTAMMSINESSGLDYTVPNDDLTRLYDFYFLTMYMDSNDDEIQFEVDHAREKNYNKVRDDIESNLQWAIFSEIFYVISTFTFWKSAIDAIESPPTPAYIQKYPSTYNMKLMKAAEEFGHHELLKDLYAGLKDLSTGDGQENFKQRNDIINNSLIKHGVSAIEFIRFAETLFGIKSLWMGRISAFGGKKWQLICDAYFNIVETEFRYEDHGKDMSIWIDRGFDRQHNNGSVLNKFKNGAELKTALDFKKNAKSAESFFNKISSSLALFYKRLLRTK